MNFGLSTLKLQTLPLSDLLEELSREYMIDMLERLCLEADVSSSPLLQGLKECKTLAELQEVLRRLMNDNKVRISDL